MSAEHAALSEGLSNQVIHNLVARTVQNGTHVYDTVADIGCGTGDAARTLKAQLKRYIGCDAVRYQGFPSEPWAEFVAADLDRTPYPIPDASADLVLAIEVIEHVENPRAFTRELARIVKPGGRVVITTPNQLSFLSKLNLIVRNQFNAFQEGPGMYPTHITALVEEDLRRIAKECRLTDIDVRYTDQGRIPFTAKHWPKPLRGRTFSDNVLLTAVRPG